MTFQEFCRDVKAAYEESLLLVHWLAAYRARRTLEVLTPDEPAQDAAYIIVQHRAGEID